MKKFVLKQNGKEVKIGDVITLKLNVSSPIYTEYIRREVVIKEDTIPALLKAGIIEPIKEEKVYNASMDINFYFNKISSKLGWKPEKTNNYLRNVYKILPAAVLSMVLREIAIELDKKYSDHIENSPEIYVISIFDGRISKVNKAHIKSYRNFAAFRSIEDAKIACRITKDLLKSLFRSE